MTCKNQKFVIRLMTEDGQMLGWAEEFLDGKQGSFVPTNYGTDIRIDKPGLAHHMTVHWCDLDVVRSEPLFTGPMEIPEDQVGSMATFYWTFKSVWFVRGDERKHLPPVAVKKPIVLCPDPAQLGAVGA